MLNKQQLHAIQEAKGRGILNIKYIQSYATEWKNTCERIRSSGVDLSRIPITAKVVNTK